MPAGVTRLNTTTTSKCQHWLIITASPTVTTTRTNDRHHVTSTERTNTTERSSTTNNGNTPESPPSTNDNETRFPHASRRRRRPLLWRCCWLKQRWFSRGWFACICQVALLGALPCCYWGFLEYGCCCCCCLRCARW